MIVVEHLLLDRKASHPFACIAAPYGDDAQRAALGVGDPPIPRRVGEDREDMIAPRHRSPAKIWAGSVNLA